MRAWEIIGVEGKQLLLASLKQNAARYTVAHLTTRNMKEQRRQYSARMQ
jgi:hypothetical protein